MALVNGCHWSYFDLFIAGFLGPTLLQPSLAGFSFTIQQNDSLGVSSFSLQDMRLKIFKKKGETRWVRWVVDDDFSNVIFQSLKAKVHQIQDWYIFYFHRFQYALVPFSMILHCVFFGIQAQLVVNCWFGARWFGFLESPYERDCYLGIPFRIPKPPGPKPTIQPSLVETILPVGNVGESPNLPKWNPEGFLEHPSCAWKNGQTHRDSKASMLHSGKKIYRKQTQRCTRCCWLLMWIKKLKDLRKSTNIIKLKWLGQLLQSDLLIPRIEVT